MPSPTIVSYEGIRDRYQALGQGHVFRFWKELEDGQKQGLLAQAALLEPRLEEMLRAVPIEPLRVLQQRRRLLLLDGRAPHLERSSSVRSRSSRRCDSTWVCSWVPTSSARSWSGHAHGSGASRGSAERYARNG